jgi:ribonuclease P protein component
VQDCELVSADAPERGVEQPAAKARATFPRGFSRAGRLLKHSDFERVYKQGRRHFSSHMTVFYLRQAVTALPKDALLKDALPEHASPEQRPCSRVGFTVGRVLGGAVQRNRIKRRMREAVRLRRVVLQDVCPVDVVMNPKKSVLTAEFSVVLDEVGRALDLIAKKMQEKDKEPALTPAQTKEQKR